jgi:hypothetical protein
MLTPQERIEKTILTVRGLRVMLDADLAVMYGLTTFNLNKAVKRNIDRFPEDFMFQLRTEEVTALRFHIGMSKRQGRGGRRYAPPVPFRRHSSTHGACGQQISPDRLQHITARFCASPFQIPHS